MLYEFFLNYIDRKRDHVTVFSNFARLIYFMGYIDVYYALLFFHRILYIKLFLFYFYFFSTVLV